MADILGLDIGGANLKAAHTAGVARSVAFPLWKHPERLADEIGRLAATMPAYTDVAITMTGELCDCFATKRDGVHAILKAVENAFPLIPEYVWSNRGAFLRPEDDPLQAAAANWRALAHYVADQFRNESVLLIDSGSTTTDLVFLDHGQPQPRGLTDPERLATGELVYTGVKRTPICAVLGMQVAAEFFATMADAYRYAGLVAEAPHDHDTADGRPATLLASRARLARMLCADLDTFSDQDASDLADRALEVQWQTVGRAIERVLTDRPALDRIVLAGSGEVLGRRVCARHPGLAGYPRTSLAEVLGPDLSEAACAYAVAMLADREKTRWRDMGWS